MCGRGSSVEKGSTPEVDIRLQSSIEDGGVNEKTMALEELK